MSPLLRDDCTWPEATNINYLTIYIYVNNFQFIYPHVTIISIIHRQSIDRDHKPPYVFGFTFHGMDNQYNQKPFSCQNIYIYIRHLLTLAHLAMCWIHKIHQDKDLDKPAYVFDARGAGASGSIGEHWGASDPRGQDVSWSQRYGHSLETMDFVGLYLVIDQLISGEIKLD